MLINTLNKVINYFGSTTQVAKALGIKQQSVSDWHRGRSEVPLDVALHLDLLMRGEVGWKELVPFETAYRLKNLRLSLKEAGVYPCELTHVLISRIHVPNSSIKHLPPLALCSQRPPCINEDYTLVFGHEVLFSYQEKSKKTIPCWRLSLQKLAEANYLTDDLTRAFLLTELAAIGIALEKFLGKRQGQRTDLVKKLDLQAELRPLSDEVRGRTDQFVANLLGLSRAIYRQLKQILQHGCPELINKVNLKRLTISKAAHVAKLSICEQKKKLKLS